MSKYSKSSRETDRASVQLRAGSGIAPGKVTLSSRLPPRARGSWDETPVQRKKASSAQTQSSQSIKSLADWTRDPMHIAAFTPHLAVQAKGDLDSDQVHEAAGRGVRGGGSSLPHLDRIQASFGAHDISGIKAHTDGAASRSCADMGASAYAMGENVAFAGSPDLHTAAHEAAHVVQQRAGVQLEGGVGQTGDAYERHADRVADLVVSKQSAEGALDQMAGGATGSASAVQKRASGGAVQFDLRDSARQQHEARGKDNPAGGVGGAHGSFQDMAEDDIGPVIRHDHGHLDDGSGNIDESLREDPTWADRIERLKWIAKLEAAELFRPDLVDGTAAYRHFLFGGGATRDIQYGRFLQNDSSGQTVLQSAIEDTRQAAIERHDQDLAGTAPTEGTRSYHIRTDTMSVTSGDARYPYPATENWQKAIGAHSIWIEAQVTVTVSQVRDPSQQRPAGAAQEGEESSSESAPPTFTRSFDVEMTIHAEDMYNFNPGDADIATGTPDSVNGRFEITGLGHEYLNQGTYTQSFDFEATMDPADSPANSGGTVDPGRSSRTGSAPGSRGRATER